MKKTVFDISTVSATIVLGFGLTGTAHSIECGDTVNLDGKKVVLDTDLNCNGHDPALSIVGPGTFDMDGHTLNCENGGSHALIVEGEKAKVLNGVVASNGSCNECIYATGAGRHTIEGMVARGCDGDGIELDSDRNTVKNSSAVRNSYGFYTLGDRNTIRDSQAVNNNIHGFDITSGINNTIRDSIAIGNGYSGFLFANSGHKIQGNTATNNVGGGFEVVSTDTRIQKNRSLDNGGDDMFDGDTDCDDNKWSNNIFGTADPADCIE